MVDVNRSTTPANKSAPPQASTSSYPVKNVLSIVEVCTATPPANALDCGLFGQDDAVMNSGMVGQSNHGSTPVSNVGYPMVAQLSSEVSPPETDEERCNSTMSKSVMKGKRKRCVGWSKDNAKTNTKLKTRRDVVENKTQQDDALEYIQKTTRIGIIVSSDASDTEFIETPKSSRTLLPRQSLTISGEHASKLKFKTPQSGRSKINAEESRTAPVRCDVVKNEVLVKRHQDDALENFQEGTRKGLVSCEVDRAVSDTVKEDAVHLAYRQLRMVTERMDSSFSSFCVHKSGAAVKQDHSNVQTNIGRSSRDLAEVSNTLAKMGRVSDHASKITQLEKQNDKVESEKLVIQQVASYSELLNTLREKEETEMELKNYITKLENDLRDLRYHAQKLEGLIQVNDLPL